MFETHLEELLDQQSIFGKQQSYITFALLEIITGILYNSKPSAYLHFSNGIATGIESSIIAILLLLLTPQVSFVADVKFGRFLHYCGVLTSCWLLVFAF